MKIKLAAHFLLLLAFSAFMLSEAETTSSQLKPHAIESFTVNYIQVRVWFFLLLLFVNLVYSVVCIMFDNCFIFIFEPKIEVRELHVPGGYKN